MPITLTDNPANFLAVTAPVNSDALSTVDMRAGLQAVADRTAGLKARIDAFSPGSGGSPGTIEFVRHGSITTMIALLAPTNRSIFMTDGDGIYQFDTSLHVTTIPIERAATDGSGTWVLVGIGIGQLDVAFGVPFLDAAARVAATKVRNGIIAVNAVTAGTAGTSLGSTSSTSYVDVPSASVSIPNVLPNDLIVVQGSIGMSSVTTGGNLAITITNPSAATTIVQELTFPAGLALGAFALCGRFQATVGGTHTLKMRFLSQGGSGTQTALGQVSLLGTLLRP